MKGLKFLLTLAFASSLHAEEIQADALLDRIVAHPGSYSQVCDVMSAPSDIPYRAFQLSDFAGASLSKANQALVTQNRDALVKAIRARLLTIDFNREAETPKPDPKPEENFDGDAYGCDPKALSPILYSLIQQLHAIEALPELLAVEQKLVEGIARAKNDAKAKPPVVTGWFVAAENDQYDEKEPEAKRNRRNDLFQARVAQRDTVMLMALLMREKSYAPYLATSLEAAYVKGMKAEAKSQKLDKLKPGPDLPKEIGGVEIVVDPVTRIVRPAWFSVAIPYTRESRDQVRAAAQKWIAEHP